MTRQRADQLLLGEWACLGILYRTPGHGFAVAARLKPDADIGRIWSMSRALTYRSLDQLTARGLIEPIAEEPGIAGGNRTILAATRTGRAALRGWLRTPVDHVRDLRSELLLKIALADLNGIDVVGMLEAQRSRIALIVDAHRVDDDSARHDLVDLWRSEAAAAALRFLDRLRDQCPRPITPPRR
jgi:DNA-binding PadR family transcriptional regulator